MDKILVFHFTHENKAEKLGASPRAPNYQGTEDKGEEGNDEK